MFHGHALSAVFLSLGLWVGMILCFEIGRRLGSAQLRRSGEGVRAGFSAVDATVYGMLAFLVGFSFSGAADRLDHRRQLVANEADGISSAWNFIEVLPSDQQPEVRSRLKHYVDVLLESYADTVITQADLLEPAELTKAEHDLWVAAVASCLTAGGERARMLLLPSMENMFGTIELERLARRIHPPGAIYFILALMALMTALFAGYATVQAPARNWLYMIGLSSTVSLAMWGVLELEYPRLGLVRVNSMDSALVEFRALMK
jgi:hypothetical protein